MPPRSGRIFLCCSMFDFLGIWPETNNTSADIDLSTFKYVFGIVRDPIDSICSTVAMTNSGSTLHNDINAAIQKYNSFAEVMIKENIIIYKFDDLKNKTEKVLRDIADIMSINIEKEFDYNSIIKKLDSFEKDNPHGYKKTFSNTNKYELAEQVVLGTDLNYTYSLYNKLLHKAELI